MEYHISEQEMNHLENFDLQNLVEEMMMVVDAIDQLMVEEQEIIFE